MSSRRDNRPCQGHDPDCNAAPSRPSPLDLAASATSIVAHATTRPSSSSSPVRNATGRNAGTIAGSVVGGVVFLVLVVLGILLYLRARKRRRTPPSSEFMNSIRAGDTPVLRLDSGAEYSPALAEKSVFTSYPPTVPQSSYYTNATKFGDDTILDTPPGQPCLERLEPQRYSSQRPDSFVTPYQPSTSAGSRREPWGSETEISSSDLSPLRRSPTHADSAFQSAPRYSFSDLSPQPLSPSRSPPLLHPLRRQPDPEGT